MVWDCCRLLSETKEALSESNSGSCSGSTFVILLSPMCLHWKRCSWRPKDYHCEWWALCQSDLSNEFLNFINHIGGYNWQEWSTLTHLTLNNHSECLWNIVGAANSLSSSPLLSYKFQLGFPEITQFEGQPVRIITFDKSKQANILGINFRTKLELETTKDILEDFFKRGW